MTVAPPDEILATAEETASTPPLLSGVAVLAGFVKTFPQKPGVYRMMNAAGDVLYVGKAKSLKKRVSSYLQIDRLPIRLQRMVFDTHTCEVVITHTEAEALLLESNLIKQLKPRYNILLRDDKSFPYIMITGDHAFPRILKHRGARAKGNEYFGPFASAGAVNATLTTLQKVFLLRSCTDAVFSNRTLVDMADRAPASLDDMRQIHGVGDVKLLRYGKAFLAVIEDWRG